MLGKYAKLFCHFSLKYIDGSSTIYQSTKLIFLWTYTSTWVYTWSNTAPYAVFLEKPP